MFRGINTVNMDTKGRVAVPKRYRQCLADQFASQIVLTIDTEQRCLLLYPLSVWEEIEEKITNLPVFHPAARRIQRLLIGHATDLVLDGHGRILVPPSLRDYAELGKRVVLLGQGKKFELWDEELWQKSRDGWLQEEDSLVKELPEQMQSLAL